MESELLWGPVNQNYQAGKRVWNGWALNFVFNSSFSDGEFRIVDQSARNKYLEVNLNKGYSDPYELLITLNHELVHFKNSKNSYPLKASGTLLGNCTTAFKVALLKDERAAFEAEIEFWNSSPDWFKGYFENIKFESRLLDSKLGYREYYRRLAVEIGKDSNFVLKRYVGLGMYPKCILDLI